MTDYYTSVCFGVRITSCEADLLREVIDLCAELCDGVEPEEGESARYARCSDAFKAAFPAGEPDNLFAALRKLFNDPDYPAISADMTIAPGDHGHLELTVRGTEANPIELAELLRVVLSGGLPFVFGYANTASRDRYDAYGGGYLHVSRERIVELVSPGEDPDEQRLVIAACSPEEGRQFWSNTAGWGELGAASVFHVHDQRHVTLPVSVPPAVWVKLPPLAAHFPTL